MLFAWLKRYMPRSLYGRAALILVMPVVTLLLIASVVFLQRHLEDVTRQMTLAVSREIDLVVDRAERVETQQQLLAEMRPLLDALATRMRFPAPDDVPDGDILRGFDLTGGVVTETIRARIPELRAIELLDNRNSRFYLDTRLGPIELIFDRRRLTPAAPHQLLVTMLFFGILMTAISFLYMRNQLRPITRLARAAQAFGHGRTVDYTPSGATEVRAAGQAFLDMRARIERQIEQRTMMLSGVSHDLRTPLTRLRLSLSLLDEEEAAPMRRDVDEMQRLLDAFLEFSRGVAESGFESLDPAELLREVVDDQRRAGLDVELVECEGQGEMTLRPMAIRRAAENLIANAMRYGTRAEVSVSLTPKSLRIRVEDDGPGIAADQRGEAIKPFVRLDPARNQDKGTGVGLGLAIVADIARAHGGTLRLGESGRLGGLCADIVIGR
ncbi:two-component system, OmpR family, osmolarity sensor histidine kinase EnvZ [Cribrihabitans marinus]|uniref:histidine kinase n=1 Tax=Cribrihabitans marinus TaxID=1227549 RepID=A0A1H7DUX0_9RHOB|nr:ATP-binding protein [Cribrihabitans marinus]GGH40278.1 two-component sensor histidine kinase [Cribrihabitans marinus]SEK05204.1 two-component system, OmpR family, osmolarity sensor histidine kinase EnvZ [Cribrihabitans marinus]